MQFFSCDPCQADGPSECERVLDIKNSVSTNITHQYYKGILLINFCIAEIEYAPVYGLLRIPIKCEGGCEGGRTAPKPV